MVARLHDRLQVVEIAGINGDSRYNFKIHNGLRRIETRVAKSLFNPFDKNIFVRSNIKRL